MNYHHKFAVSSSLEDVENFHRQSLNLVKITPPLIYIRMHKSPKILFEGAEMEFTLWFGPFPIRWHSQIVSTSQTGFVDRQVFGPFKSWTHTHKYMTTDKQTIIVVDEIQAELKRHPIWFFVGIGIWIGMPILFAYRSWKTKRELN